MRTALFRIAIALAIILTLPSVSSAAQYKSDTECLSVSSSTPFFELNLSRQRISHQTTEKYNRKDHDLGEQVWKWDTSTAVSQDMDHTLAFDNAGIVLDGATYVSRRTSSGTCFDVTLSLYDVSVTLGKALYGACEPLLTSRAGLSFSRTWDSSPGVYVGNLNFDIDSAFGMSCGTPVGYFWVEGWLHGDLDIGIESDKSRNEMKRYIDLDVRASAAAGIFPNSPAWEWDYPIYSSRLYQETERY